MRDAMCDPRKCSIPSCLASQPQRRVEIGWRIESLFAIVLSIHATRLKTTRVSATNSPYRTSNFALPLQFLFYTSSALPCRAVSVDRSIAFVCFQLRSQKFRFPSRTQATMKLTVFGLACILIRSMRWWNKNFISGREEIRQKKNEKFLAKLRCETMVVHVFRFIGHHFHHFQAIRLYRYTRKSQHTRGHKH